MGTAGVRTVVEESVASGRRKYICTYVCTCVRTEIYTYVRTWLLTHLLTHLLAECTYIRGGALRAAYPGVLCHYECMYFSLAMGARWYDGWSGSYTGVLSVSSPDAAAPFVISVILGTYFCGQGWWL